MAGRIRFLSKSGSVIKLHGGLLLEERASLLAKHQAYKEVASGRGSQRVRDEYGTTMHGVAVANRPVDLSLYAFVATINTHNKRAIEAKAEDIAGSGWAFSGGLGSKGTDAANKLATDWLKGAACRRSFKDFAVCVETDYQALGNAFIEVIPNRRGEPEQLEHLPSVETYVRLDGLGFLQRRGRQHAHFRNFWVDDLEYAKLPANDPLHADRDHNSVISFYNYSPWSPVYGLPPVMPAWNALALNTLVAEYNLQFFGNNAIPDYAVILDGEWEDAADQAIEEYFRTRIKGNAHSTMVLQSPQGGSAKFHKLTGDNAKEGSFRLLRQDCRDEILQAHGVPPQKIGIVETGALGGNVGSEQIRDYGQLVRRGQERWEAAIEALIERRGLTNVSFSYEPYDTEDEKLNAEIDKTYIDAGVVEPDEVRSTRFPQLGERPVDSRREDPATKFEKSIAGLQRSLFPEVAE